MNLVEIGNKYYDEKKPWILYKENIEEFNKVIYNCTYIIANLANLFEPIMPDTSKKIAEYLSIDIKSWKPIILRENIELKNINPIFEKIK